jgi:hypothetical protein
VLAAIRKCCSQVLILCACVPVAPPTIHTPARASAQPEEPQRILPTGIYSIRLVQGRANCEFRGALGVVLTTTLISPPV